MASALSYLIVILFSIISLLNVNGRTSDSLRVTLSDGESKLLGRYMRSHDGKGIRAFLGIPYAEAPLGKLRFKPPVPVRPWKEERKAQHLPPACLQLNPFFRSYELEGEEDCLFLNVYAPQEPTHPGPLPVMVWIHGGGFMCGETIFYGPDHLMDHDIIYVAIQYRLGPLGFLSTGESSCPGNNGLKDQVQALKWIQQNIAAFGGDPNSVTIFGESAGGASTTYLMTSPMAKGLFHRAISQSGSHLNPWSQPAHEGVATKRAIRLGKMLGCKKEGDNWAKLVECLRGVDGGEITKAFYKFFEWDMDPMVPFPPVVEPDLPGAFLTKHPRDIIESHGTSLPWMTGVTLDEGLLKTAAVFNLKHIYDDFKVNIEKAMAVSLFYDHHDKDVQNNIKNKIMEYYFNNQPLTEETHQNLTNIYSDNWFVSGIDDYIRMRLDAKNADKVGPTYVYLFAHKGAASITELFKGGSEIYHGVAHADELQYLFPVNIDFLMNSIPSSGDHQIRKILTKLWVDFARTSNPTPPETNLPTWKPAKGYPLDYLRIGNKDLEARSVVAMENGLMDERTEFWRKLQVHLPAKKFYKEEL